jgi:hypothetical protein
MTTRTKKLPSKKKPTVLCLRTVETDGTAYDGFKWPALGFVEAPDWEPTKECGHGLHGYLRGCGDADSINWGSLFQAVKVIESEIVDLDGKVKFPRCEVIFTGSRKGATDILVKEYGNCSNVIGATVVVNGRGQHAIAGYKGTATSTGDGGKATAGHCGTATSAGYYGMAMAGDRGTAMAGYGGTATTGKFGTATAGDGGTATAGHYGTATVGVMGRISILYWDGQRSREVIGYIGENGLEPNVPYKLNDKHEFVKA